MLPPPATTEKEGNKTAVKRFLLSRFTAVFMPLIMPLIMLLILPLILLLILPLILLLILPLTLPSIISPEDPKRYSAGHTSPYP